MFIIIETNKLSKSRFEVEAHGLTLESLRRVIKCLQEDETVKLVISTRVSVIYFRYDVSIQGTDIAMSQEDARREGKRLVSQLVTEGVWELDENEPVAEETGDVPF